MRKHTLLLRDVLLLTTGALTLLIALFIARDIYVEGHRLVQVQSLKEATIFGDRLFDAAERLSEERDIAFSMLYSDDPDSLKELRARLDDDRAQVDRTLEGTLKDLQNYDLEGFSYQLDQSKAQFADLHVLRSQIDSAVALPLATRDLALPQRWFDESTSIILQTQNLWMQFVKHFVGADPFMIFNIRFKHILGIIMDYSGRQRSLIGRLLAQNADPTPQEQAQLLQWQGMTELGWTVSDALADEGGLYPAIAPAFKDAKSHYFNVHDMVRDIFYIPGAHHGVSYPIGVAFWLDMATETTDSLNALKDAALKKTRDYVDALQSEVLRSIFYHALLLLFALGLCCYSFWIVIYRVIRPVNNMVQALVDASQGKPTSVAPPTFSRQDEIGQLAFVLHVFQQNVDEMKRTSTALGESEKQLHHSQKMEAIGNLTGGMAHDFNNLLGIIIGNLDLLNDRLKDRSDDTPQLSQSAMEAALRGADLTRRLLAFARQQPLQPQRIDINKLVDGITKLLSRTLGENIEVSLKLADEIWPAVADPAQLEAAIANLATNARDAMPQGGKIIIATYNGHLDADYASLHPEVTPGEFAIVEVSDTGTGMTPEVANRIFEPFFTTKERGKGTGLGLAMVFGFMKQSGGHVNVYSEVGKGTTFRLYLPRSIAVAAEAVQQTAPRPAKGGNETVLIVEDNEAMRDVVARQLGELGYRTLQVGNAAAALETLAANDKIDLLFTDIVMPGKLDGLGLARMATKRWPSLKVVLTSGFPESKIDDQKELLAGLRLLSKPYRKQDLAHTLRDVLDGRSGRNYA